MPVEAASVGIAALCATVVLSAAVLVAHVWLSVTRGHRSLVLRAVPVALAPLTLPLPAAIWSIIASFNGIARTGSSGLTLVAPILQGFVRVQWLGVLAAGAIVIIAAVVERLGATHIERASPAPGPARSGWGNWILVGSAALLLPVAAENMFVHRIPHLIMEIARSVSLPDSAATQPENISGLAQSLSSQLVLGLVSGVVASVAVLLGISGSLVVSSAVPPSRPQAVAGWIMVALAVAAVIGGVAGYGADMRWLSALAKGSPG